MRGEVGTAQERRPQPESGRKEGVEWAGPLGWDWAEGDWAAGSWAGSGLLGWVAVGFGVCWVFFFSISIYSLFSILIQTKFEFKYKFEFKPHSNN